MDITSLSKKDSGKCNSFVYNEIMYFYLENSNDPSTYGCIHEIIVRDDYELSKFKSDDENTFIDIGANCGIATLILGKQNPRSIVYSFEPDPKLFKVLEKNVLLNRLTNVRLFNKAVAKEGIDYLDLFLHPEYTGGNTTCASKESSELFFNKNLESVKVECISLDQIIKVNNIQNVKLLKIDCEGAEYEILYGSNLFKTNIVENMVGEFHNLSYNDKVKSDTTELLNYCRPFVNGVFKITLLTL